MIFAWQQNQWEQVAARFAEDALAHGLLVSGPAGIGKHVFAQALAARILCSNAKALEQACGLCSGCKLFQANTHPDFIQVSPEEGKQTISISQIRRVVEQLNQTANAGGFQVVCIHPAHNMTHSAANALLKTLEEPPGPVVLLLVSDQPSALPATILSRCQTVRMIPPSYPQAKAWLLGVIEDANHVEHYLAFADGLPLLAKYYAEQDLSVVDSLLQCADPIKLASASHKDQPEQVLQWLLSLTMDLVRLKTTQSPSVLHHQHYAVVLQKIAAQWDGARLFEYLDELMQDLNLLKRQANPNVQLLLEKVLIGWVACQVSAE